MTTRWPPPRRAGQHPPPGQGPTRLPGPLRSVGPNAFPPTNPNALPPARPTSSTPTVTSELPSAWSPFTRKGESTLGHPFGPIPRDGIPITLYLLNLEISKRSHHTRSHHTPRPTLSPGPQEPSCHHPATPSADPPRPDVRHRRVPTGQGTSGPGRAGPTRPRRAAAHPPLPGLRGLPSGHQHDHREPAGRSVHRAQRRRSGSAAPPPGVEAACDSVAAAIEYAVEILRGSSITVCGHSGRGTMRALLTATPPATSDPRTSPCRGHRRPRRTTRRSPGGCGTAGRV